MPNQNTDAELALRKLGERLRAGWVKKHPVPEQSLKTVREAVRGQWEREQVERQNKKGTPQAGKGRKPPEPDRER